MYLGQCLPSNVEGLAKVTVRTLKRDEILNVVSSIGFGFTMDVELKPLKHCIA